MKSIVRGILIPNEGIWMKSFSLWLIIFALLVYDVQSATSIKSIPICILAFMFENFYLNLNIGLYLILGVLFSANKLANPEEYIEEEQIWHITYEFFWIDQNSNTFKRAWKYSIVTLAAKLKN